MSVAPLQNIAFSTGNSFVLEYNLTDVNGDVLSPGDAYSLIFTAKRFVNDPDTLAIVQKASGAGITVVGSKAFVAFVPEDTINLGKEKLTCDIKAQHLTTGAVVTVARGNLLLTPIVTQGTTTSVEIFTSQPPIPLGGGLDTLIRSIAQGPPKQVYELTFAGVAANGTSSIDYEIHASDASNVAGSNSVSHLATDSPSQLAQKVLDSIGVIPDFTITRRDATLVFAHNTAEITSFVFNEAIAGVTTSTAAVWTPVAEGIGQVLRYGDGSPYSWYRWDGAVWEPLVTSPDWSDISGIPADVTNITALLAAKHPLISYPIPRPAQPVGFTYAPHATTYVNFGAGVATAIMQRFTNFSPPYLSRSLQLTFAQWAPSFLGTVDPTVSLAVRAAIEYPVGVFHPLFFNGKRDGVIDALGQIETDPLDIQLPANTQFWIRVFVSCRTGDLMSIRSTYFLKNVTGMKGAYVVGKAGTAATATLTAAAGVITTAVINTSGGGYPPNAEIACTVTGAGTGASIVAITGDGGFIDGLRILSGGTGYTGTPTLAIPGNATGVGVYQGTGSGASGGAAPVDMTTSGTMADFTGAAGTLAGYGPSVIKAIPATTTAHRSYAILGDSIGTGYFDTNAGYMGWPHRVFNNGANKIPIINLSFGGASLWRSVASGKSIWKHISLANGCTDVIIPLGRNDLTDGRTLVQMQADLLTLVTEIQSREMRAHVCTVTPGTNAANTATLGSESTRVGYNDFARTCPYGIVACWDTADAVEVSRNGGLWKAGAFSTGATGDSTPGVHVSPVGFDLMAAVFTTLTP